MSRKILLADDSVTIRKVVELTFMEEDYDLEAAADGREALSWLEGSAPDMVIADIHMPEVGGLEVARDSKRRYPDVPVLLLVGTFEAFDPDDVKACGAEDFLKKPFDSQDLLKKVKNLLEQTAGKESRGAGPVPETAVTAADGPKASSATSLAAQKSEGDDGATAVADQPPTGVLSDEDIDRIARRVAEILTSEVVREVAWEVVPDTAEIVIKERLRELESQVE